MKRWVWIALLTASCTSSDDELLGAASLERVLPPAVRFGSTPVRGVVLDSSGRPVRGAIVAIERDGTTNKADRTSHEWVLRPKHDGVPHLLARAGDTLVVRNAAEPHAFEFDHPKRQSSAFLPPGASRSIALKPGLTRIGCAVHGPFATVLALNSEADTRTDEQGRFEFAGVESGWVHVVVWHGPHRLGAQRIRIGVARTVELSFSSAR